ncbi:MAG TPA: sulfonate ABC transporter ATP-binding protein [Syntrophobacteraceae bacterium]|jgi:NitT/TauT family transport system ATP-binding protein|nr:sulfonate ABC transporter ATP-binding protein [Syntrophobacteraceae bacterium]HBD06896.1 sulfonate ABC transporter ATP-binding protein [Syntrophobacteraceae bacterium]
MNGPQAVEPTIRIRDLRKVFSAEGREVVALDRIDLEVAPGEFVCLLGPSGCGKSTLLNIIAGFVSPTSGEVVVNHRPVVSPGPDRAMIFQEYALFPWMTVEGNIAFGMEIQGMPRQELRERVDTLLHKLHLVDFRDRFPKDLSGGMRQRVAIARAIALDSPTLLADEPFGALDALTRSDLQNELLRVWSELRQTIVFVTHGIEESIYLADRVVVMTYRPGTIKRIIPIALSRPRDPASPEFNAIKREVAQLVLEEQAQYEAAEARQAEIG